MTYVIPLEFGNCYFYCVLNTRYLHFLRTCILEGETSNSYNKFQEQAHFPKVVPTSQISYSMIQLLTNCDDPLLTPRNSLSQPNFLSLTFFLQKLISIVVHRCCCHAGTGWAPRHNGIKSFLNSYGNLDQGGQCCDGLRRSPNTMEAYKMSKFRVNIFLNYFQLLMGLRSFQKSEF